jgi:hypothetical protein
MGVLRIEQEFVFVDNSALAITGWLLQSGKRSVRKVA